MRSATESTRAGRGAGITLLALAVLLASVGVFGRAPVGGATEMHDLVTRPTRSRPELVALTARSDVGLVVVRARGFERQALRSRIAALLGACGAAAALWWRSRRRRPSALLSTFVRRSPLRRRAPPVIPV